MSSALFIIRNKDGKTDKYTELIQERFISFTYEESDTASSKMVVELDNHDLRLLDDEYILNTNKLQLQWGSEHNLVTPKKLTITGIKGFLTIELHGTGRVFKHSIEQKKRLWENKTYYQIVREVAKEMDYINPDIKDPELSEVSIQQFEDNASFLQRLAKRVGYSFWIDAENLHWRPRELKDKARVNLVWKGTVKHKETTEDFGYIIEEPTFEYEVTRYKPKKKKVRGLRSVICLNTNDPCKAIELLKKQGKLGKNVSGAGKITIPDEGYSIEETSVQIVNTVNFKKAEEWASEIEFHENPKEWLRHKIDTLKEIVKGEYDSDLDNQPYFKYDSLPISANPAELEAKHIAYVYAPTGKAHRAKHPNWVNNMDRMKVTVTIRGLKDLHVGDTVRMLNVGKLLEGLYYVKKIVHKIGDYGFIQELELGRGTKPKGKGKKKPNDCKIYWSSKEKSWIYDDGKGTHKKITAYEAECYRNANNASSSKDKGCGGNNNFKDINDFPDLRKTKAPTNTGFRDIPNFIDLRKEK